MRRLRDTVSKGLLGGERLCHRKWTLGFLTAGTLDRGQNWLYRAYETMSDRADQKSFSIPFSTNLERPPRPVRYPGLASGRASVSLHRSVALV